MLIQWLNRTLEMINQVVWGNAVTVFMIAVGIFLSFRLDFLQLRKFTRMLKDTVCSLFSKKHHQQDSGGVSPFQAVSTALAGTIGTGSIVGLATALSTGGPGAIFWMWVSAFLGMATKYAEIVLSLRFRERNRKGRWVGGPMYYIQNGLGLRPLAILFAIFAILACFGMGNAVQANSISMALKSAVGIDEGLTGTVLLILVGLVILGGVKRIASVNEKMVPAMALFYILCSGMCLVVNRKRIPSAFFQIIKSAFSLKSAAGGAVGFSMALAVQKGFSCGVFSNEAGLGSAPIAHAASAEKEPVAQGMWGMFEVFFTTTVICTLSGLVVLTSGLWEGTDYQGAALSIAAFDQAVPGLGKLAVTLSTVLFALSTILGWAYYGEVCLGFLTRKTGLSVILYRVLYVAVTFFGAIGNLDVIWSISETMNGLMAIPNLIAIVGLSGIVVDETRHFFQGKQNKIERRGILRK